MKTRAFVQCLVSTIVVVYGGVIHQANESNSLNHTVYADLSDRDDVQKDGLLLSDFKFAVFIDAGSTGSRAHLFPWRTLDDGNIAVHLAGTKTWKLRPGLGTFIVADGNYATAPGTVFSCIFLEQSLHFLDVLEKLQQYLLDLKNGVFSLLPENAKHSETPVWILGTAGFRSIEETAREQLLQKVRDSLDSWGLTTSKKAVRVIDGDEEGVYAWLALAQLYQADKDRRIQAQQTWVHEIVPRPLSKLSPHVPALLELGGASVQIVFRADNSTDNPSKAFSTDAAGKHVINKLAGDFVDFVLGEDSVRLFAKSFLGLGRQTALQRFLSAVEEARYLPCLPSNMEFPIQVESIEENIGRVLGDDPSDDTEPGDMIDCPSCRKRKRRSINGHRGHPETTFQHCRKLVSKLLFEEAQSGSTQHDEKLDREIASYNIPLPDHLEIIGTENVYYMYGMVFDPEKTQGRKMTIGALRARADQLCALHSTDEILPLLHEAAEFEKAATGCFGLTFISEFLDRVLNLDSNRELTVEHRILGVEIGWIFGYALAELQSQQLRFLRTTIKPQEQHDEL